MGKAKPRLKLNSKLRALVKEFSDWWETSSKALDAANAVREPLYHYTDTAGLIGVLDNRQLWFTHIQHLNDPSELQFGARIAAEMLEDQAERGNDAAKMFCDMAKRTLTLGSEVLGFYVASFSRARDDLGQWRAYGDNARGVSIGFAPKLFQIQYRTNLGLNEKTILAPVIYANRDDDHRDAIGRALEIAMRGVRDATSPEEGFEFFRELSTLLAVPIFSYSMSAKDPAYENEREVRLLLSNDLDRLAPVLSSRARGSRLVPFIKSPLPVPLRQAIAGIVVGPAAGKLAKGAVQSLLRRHKISPDIVEVSRIPYVAH